MSRTVVAASTSPSEQPLLAAEDPEQSARAPVGNENAILQFSTELFFATEGEDHQMQIDVVRLGDSTGVSKVDYKTVDASAKAGEKYEATSGTLTFEAGEHTKSITVEILDDDKWNATLEFKVDLENPQGAQLGKYLHTCRVKVIDDDLFPTNKYAENFKSGTQEEIPGAGLFFEYIKLCLHDPQVKWKTIKCILLDQLKGVYFFITMWLQLYMIDTVLGGHGEHGEGGEEGGEAEEGGEHGEGEAHERLLRGVARTASRAAQVFLPRLLHAEAGEGGEGGEGGEEGEEEEELGFMLHTLLIKGSVVKTAVVVAAIYCLPILLIHATDFWMCYISLRGSLRKNLQANLLRKFLNYREEIRPKLSLSKIQMAMVRDVPEVVEMGYLKVLALIRIAGKLMFALVFILAESPIGAVPLVVCPVLLGIFLCCREYKTMEVAELQAHAQDHVVQQVTDTVKNYRLIADFNMRPMIVDGYEATIDDYVIQESHALGVLTNNAAMAPLLSTLCIGIYIIYSAMLIAHGHGGHSIGTFVTTINVFKEVGMEIQEITMELIEIQRTFEPLQKIANYMNMPTDMADRKRINRMRRQDGASRREDAKKTKAEGAFAVDAIPISVKDLSFKFGEGELLLSKVTAEWEQGKLYAFVGPAHQGKGTLLKLLGQVYLPQEGGGSVFVPPHLRILHVSQECHLVSGSLLENILLNQTLERVGGLERVKKICKMLDFEQKILNCLDTKETTWTTLLTDTASSRLVLARALCMNPEVLAIHKPTTGFNEPETKNIMKLLRAHVEEKGLALPPGEKKLRRPRTVFMSHHSLEKQDGMDGCYRISKDGIQKL